MKKILLALLTASLLFSVSGCKKKNKPEPSPSPEVTATTEAEKGSEETKEPAESEKTGATAEPKKTEKAEKKTEEKETQKAETAKPEAKKEEKVEEAVEDDEAPEYKFSTDYVVPQPEVETETVADIDVETVPVEGADSMTEANNATEIITGQETTDELDEAGVADALKRAEEAARRETENWE